VGKLRAFVERLLREPPYRLFSKVAVTRFATSVRIKARWQ
jgi:hypothetical protein